MESLRQQLSIDNFSYNRLLNIEPSIDSLDDGLRFSLDTQDPRSFIEMDPKLISMRWKAGSIDFDFSLLQWPASAATSPHQPTKSELAANSSTNSGLIRSLSIDPSKSLLSGSNRFGSRYFDTVPSGPISLNSSSLFSPVQGVPTSSCSSSRGNNSKLHFLGGCAKSSNKKFFQRYLSFPLPPYKKFKGLKSMRRVAGSRVSSTRSCMHGIDRIIPEEQ